MMERAPQPVREMLALLRESGHTPYLVGGCVRDLLRGAEPDDYDMTSDARPEEVMAIFGASAHPTGLMHGTVTLVRDGAQAVPPLPCGARRVFLDRKAQHGREAQQAQNAERILGKAPRRVADAAQDARTQILPPAEGIDKRSLR